MLYGRKNKNGQNILLETMHEIMKGIVIDITKFINHHNKKNEMITKHQKLELSFVNSTNTLNHIYLRNLNWQQQ